MDTLKIFTPIKLNSDYRFKSIQANGDCSFAINQGDQLFGWGRNDCGQIGQQPSITIIGQPLKIMQAKSLTISPGCKHNFAFNKSSRVVCWGLNQNGQLGKQKSVIQKPAPLKIFQQAKDIGLNVIQISCGQDHSLAILSNQSGSNSLFSWGNNKFWQLAIQSTDDVPYPFKTDFQQDPIQIAAMHNYSALITKDGRVFTWGSGQFGRLGYQTLTKQQRVPRQITQLQKIQKISLGIYHGLAINYDGQVFSWGRGLNGQLGHNSFNNQNRPKIISAIKQRVIAIVAGQHHSVFLGRGGQIWTCGGGSFGQLGLGQKVLRCLVPTKVQLGTCIMIACGSKHTMSLNISGQIFCWGSNQYSQLGYQNKKTRIIQSHNQDLQFRVKVLQDTVEQLKQALLQQRRFKASLLKFLQRNFTQAANGFQKFLKQM